MSTGLYVLAVAAAVLFAIALWREPKAIRPAFAELPRQFSIILLRLPFALIAAAYIGLILPRDAVASLLGAQGGMQGILLAMLLGAIVPGGPVISFPFALVLWHSGAGRAQMVTFLTSWTVIAGHRSLSFEIPFVGLKFTGFRLASSWMMPFLAGGIALVLVTFLRP